MPAHDKLSCLLRYGSYKPGEVLHFFRDFRSKFTDKNMLLTRPSRYYRLLIASEGFAVSSAKLRVVFLRFLCKNIFLRSLENR